MSFETGSMRTYAYHRPRHPLLHLPLPPHLHHQSVRPLRPLRHRPRTHGQQGSIGLCVHEEN